MTTRVLATLAILAVASPSAFPAAESWSVLVPGEYRDDEAVRVCLDDLRRTAAELSFDISIRAEGEAVSGNVIVVGAPPINRYAAEAVRDGKVKLAGVDDEQGYEIATIDADEGRTVFIAGGSILGDVYGLYWICDRLRVHKEIPAINVNRVPHLKVRLTGGETQDSIRMALRHGATWVSGGNILNFVPWGAEPERRENEGHREDLKELAEYAHSLHLKFIPYCDEITFHPSLMEEFDASLSPDDPALWDALQEKYRLFLRAAPFVDGVRIRTGELTRIFGNYEAYDVMHERGESGWTLEETYRTFIQKMHEVVVGEFDKIYFHRTWVTTANEQHSSADVYAKIFTGDVPAAKLYLSPYLSLADRWYYQPYNPTFNVTPHNMVVLLATLDYHAHAGVSIFPSFPGPYYQGGLEQILAPSDSNLTGIHFGVPKHDGWDTLSLTAYTASRLAWNPDEGLRIIARDFASMHYGPDVAEAMAEIYMLSPVAYKDGIYIKPVAENIRGNTLLHLRLTTFPVQGIPELDKGRAHIDWLYSTMFRPCESKKEEALNHLDRGQRAAQEMCRIYQEVSPSVEDRELAGKTAESLELARLLVETNNLYVKTCFAYFDYRDEHSNEKRKRLAEVSSSLRETVERFLAAPGCIYRVFGIDQLLKSVDTALQDIGKAEKTLASALDTAQTEKAIIEQQGLHKRAVEEHAHAAKKFLHWEGFVDGRDIVVVQGESVTIKHLQSDPIQSVKSTVFSPLPKREVTVILDDGESRAIHPFVLEQPNQANDYTARIYIFDAPGGSGQFNFDLYYVDEKPEELGLQVPW